MEDLTPAHLTPAQQRVLVDLMASGRPRPRFEPTMADELRSELESGLGPLDGVSSDKPMWVSKGALADVHTCEAYSQARGDWPGWTARTARGTVVHRALETMVGSREELAPLEVVDHAIARMAADDTRSSLAPWLAEASPLDLADLRAGANEVVAKFVECWPPLKAAWRPRTEVSLRQELCSGRVVLSGKVDLVLGLARGDEARSLIVDLKTGPPYPSHLDDLRFYALLQTLRVGVPPFRVASYYLDSATFHAEDVTTATLAIAVHRTVDGIGKLAELAGGRPPGITPCPACRWCRLAATCDGPRQWREARRGSDDEEPSGDVDGEEADADG